MYLFIYVHIYIYVYIYIYRADFLQRLLPSCLKLILKRRPESKDPERTKRFVPSADRAWARRAHSVRKQHQTWNCSFANQRNHRRRSRKVSRTHRQRYRPQRMLRLQQLLCRCCCCCYFHSCHFHCCYLYY